MTKIPSASNQDPTLYCAYFGGPRDGLKSGDLPSSLSGKKLTGMVSKMPLTQPHELSLYAVYECISEAQVNGYWEFHYQGTEGPNGEKLIASASDSVTALAGTPKGNKSPHGETLSTTAIGKLDGALQTATEHGQGGDSALTAAAFVAAAVSRNDTFIGLYALVPDGASYIREAGRWNHLKGPALNTLHGRQLIEIEKGFVGIFDLLESSGKTPTLGQIASLSTSGRPASWDTQAKAKVDQKSGGIRPGHACSDVAEFNSLLLTWLDKTGERTIGAGAGKTHVTVPIGGYPCGLSAETTRAGVRSYLSQVLSGDRSYSVVPSSKGVVHRVAVGRTYKRIRGFYLYTQEPFDEPKLIAPVEASHFSVHDVANLILDAVAVLHARGHQRLRIFPNISGSGNAWRIAICSIDALAGENWPVNTNPGAVFRYTTADEFEVGMLHVESDTSADEVADAILESLPDSGLGRDWAYVGWFSELHGLARRHGKLPVGDDIIDWSNARLGWTVGPDTLDGPPQSFERSQ